eukprot:gene10435-11529_t
MSTPITQSFRPVVNEARKIAGIWSAVFIAKHTAFSSVDHLVILLPSIFPDSTIAANLLMQRSNCTGLIVNLISQHIFQGLVDDMGDSFYSLVIDEWMDGSQKKMLAICIQYYSASRQSIRATFLKMLNLGASGTSDTIRMAARKTLEQAGLGLENLIGIGVDGCSMIVGVNHTSHVLNHMCLHLFQSLSAGNCSSAYATVYNWLPTMPQKLCQLILAVL